MSLTIVEIGDSTKLVRFYLTWDQCSSFLSFGKAKRSSLLKTRQVNYKTICKAKHLRKLTPSFLDDIFIFILTLSLTLTHSNSLKCLGKLIHYSRLSLAAAEIWSKAIWDQGWNFTSEAERQILTKNLSLLKLFWLWNENSLNCFRKKVFRKKLICLIWMN